MCNFAFVLIHLVHLIFLLLWDKPNIRVEQNCFFSKKRKKKNEKINGLFEFFINTCTDVFYFEKLTQP